MRASSQPQGHLSDGKWIWSVPWGKRRIQPSNRSRATAHTTSPSGHGHTAHGARCPCGTHSESILMASGRVTVTDTVHQYSLQGLARNPGCTHRPRLGASSLHSSVSTYVRIRSSMDTVPAALAPRAPRDVYRRVVNRRSRRVDQVATVPTYRMESQDADSSTARLDRARCVRGWRVAGSMFPRGAMIGSRSLVDVCARPVSYANSGSRP